MGLINLTELKVGVVITLILKLLLTSIFPYLIYIKDYTMALATLIAIFITLLPFFLKRTYKINVPWLFDFLIVLALYMHTGGVVFRWYETYPFWDIILHLLGPAIIALLGFSIVYILYFIKKINLSIPMIALFAFMFSLGISTLWEIGEFTTDSLIGTNSQPSLEDTNWDLIFNTLSAFIVSLLGMIYVRFTPEKKVQHYIYDILGRELSN